MSRRTKVFSNSEIFIGFHLLEPIFNNYDRFASIRAIVQDLIINEIECLNGEFRNQVFRANNSAAVLGYRHLKYVALKLYPTDKAQALKAIGNELLFASIDLPSTRYEVAPLKPSHGQFCAHKKEAHFSGFFSNPTMPVIPDDKALLKHIENIYLLKDLTTLPLLSYLAPDVFAMVAKEVNLQQQIQMKKEAFVKPVIQYLHKDTDSDITKKRIKELEYFITDIVEYEQVPMEEIILAVEWSLLRIKLERQMTDGSDGIRKHVGDCYESLNKCEASKEEELKESCLKALEQAKTLSLGVVPTLTTVTLMLIKHIQVIPALRDHLAKLNDESLTSNIAFIKANACLNALQNAYQKEQQKAYKLNVLQINRATAVDAEPTQEHSQNNKYKKLLFEAVQVEQASVNASTQHLQNLTEQKEIFEAKLKSPLNHRSTDAKRAQTPLRKEIKDIKGPDAEDHFSVRSFSTASFSSIRSHSIPLPPTPEPKRLSTPLSPSPILDSKDSIRALPVPDTSSWGLPLPPVDSLQKSPASIPLPPTLDPSSRRLPLPPVDSLQKSPATEIIRTEPKTPVKNPTAVAPVTKTQRPTTSLSMQARMSIFENSKVSPEVSSDSPGKPQEMKRRTSQFAEKQKALSSLNISQVLKPRSNVLHSAPVAETSSAPLQHKVGPRIYSARKKPTRKPFVNPSTSTSCTP